MAEVALSAGTIEYSDTGGDGPVLVFLHGLAMDSTVWRKVVPELSEDHRCVLPTLPLGGHRKPMRPDADLTLTGLASLVEEFLAALDLRDVTLVVNDWGGPQLLISDRRCDRIARVVLTSCEAFDNYPPGLPGRLVERTAKVPGGLRLMMGALLRVRALRRAPGGWGWMSKRPVPHEVMDGWFTPAARDAAIRRDLAKYAVSTPAKAELLAHAERMRGFDRPVLIVWGTEDKIMPPEHAHRLAELFTDATLVLIPDGYTLLPEDRPEPVADSIREFVADNPL